MHKDLEDNAAVHMPCDNPARTYWTEMQPQKKLTFSPYLRNSLILDSSCDPIHGIGYVAIAYSVNEDYWTHCELISQIGQCWDLTI